MSLLSLDVSHSKVCGGLGSNDFGDEERFTVGEKDQVLVEFESRQKDQRDRAMQKFLHLQSRCQSNLLWQAMELLEALPQAAYVMAEAACLNRCKKDQ